MPQSYRACPDVCGVLVCYWPWVFLRCSVIPRQVSQYTCSAAYIPLLLISQTQVTLRPAGRVKYSLSGSTLSSFKAICQWSQNREGRQKMDSGSPLNDFRLPLGHMVHLSITVIAVVGGWFHVQLSRTQRIPLTDLSHRTPFGNAASYLM